MVSSCTAYAMASLQSSEGHFAYTLPSEGNLSSWSKQNSIRTTSLKTSLRFFSVSADG